MTAGAKGRLVLLNVALFALLWNSDLFALLSRLEALRAERSLSAGWQRKQAARFLALTILESCETLKGLLGKDFRRELETFAGKEAVVLLGPIHRDLSRFLKQHGDDLRHIRVTIVAHRDPDASVQLAAMRGVDVARMATLGNEMVEWNTRLFTFLLSYFKKTP